VIEGQKTDAAQLLEKLVNTVKRSTRPAALNAHRFRANLDAQRFLAQGSTIGRLAGTTDRIRPDEHRA